MNIIMNMDGSDAPANGGRAGVVAAGIAAAAAIAAAYGYEAAALGDLGASTLNSRVAPPAEFVRAGLAPAVSAQPPGRAWLDVLGHALERRPLQQRLMNRFYVEAMRRNDSGAAARDAALLPRLGWRDTSTTQNLMLRYAIALNAGPLLDRGESLLRREQLEDNVFRFLAAVEAVPQMQGALTARLRGNPPWRARYFAYAPLLESDVLRTARAATIEQLLASGFRLSRAEIATLVGVMVAKGEDEQAWRLWQRTGNAGAATGLADPDFAIAHRLRTIGAPTTPFDWQVGADNDSAATLPDYRPRGVGLRWNGRGVPVFLTQRLRLTGTGGLTVRVALAQPQIALRYLEPVLTCRDRELSFEPAGQRQHLAIFSAQRPAGCTFATFSIRGKPTDDPTPGLGDIDSVTLVQN